MTLQEVVKVCQQLSEESDIAASMDAGFDAGEFSGPAHAEMLETKIEQVAKENGFTTDEVYIEMFREQQEFESSGTDDPRSSQEIDEEMDERMFEGR